MSFRMSMSASPRKHADTHAHKFTHFLKGSLSVWVDLGCIPPLFLDSYPLPKAQMSDKQWTSRITFIKLYTLSDAIKILWKMVPCSSDCSYYIINSCNSLLGHHIYYFFKAAVFIVTWTRCPLVLVPWHTSCSNVALQETAICILSWELYVLHFTFSFLLFSLTRFWYQTFGSVNEKLMTRKNVIKPEH